MHRDWLRPAADMWFGSKVTKRMSYARADTLTSSAWALAMILPSLVACSAPKVNQMPCMLTVSSLSLPCCGTMDAPWIDGILTKQTPQGLHVTLMTGP